MAIKSAFELAMERMGGAAPKLTAAQKKKIADLDQRYTAKIAEQELALQPKIEALRAKGDRESAQKLEDQLRHEIAKLRDKLETEKAAVRQS